MSKGKPRHNPNKPQHHLFRHCPYDDGSKGKECNNPFAYYCDGDRYKCYKLYLHHLASLSESGKQRFLERYGENTKWGAPRTNTI